MKWLKARLIPWNMKAVYQLHERWGVSELRVICTVAEEWGKLTCQLHDRILIHWNLSWKVITLPLKSLVTKGLNLGTLWFTDFKMLPDNIVLAECCSNIVFLGHSRIKQFKRYVTGTGSIPILNHLTWLISREDYIKSCRCESFKTYIMHLYREDINQKITVPGTLYFLNHLTLLVAQEDYIKSCSHESFKTYRMLFYLCFVRGQVVATANKHTYCDRLELWH